MRTLLSFAAAGCLGCVPEVASFENLPDTRLAFLVSLGTTPQFSTPFSLVGSVPNPAPAPLLSDGPTFVVLVEDADLNADLRSVNLDAIPSKVGIRVLTPVESRDCAEGRMLPHTARDTTGVLERALPKSTRVFESQGRERPLENVPELELIRLQLPLVFSCEGMNEELHWFGGATSNPMKDGIVQLGDEPVDRERNDAYFHVWETIRLPDDRLVVATQGGLHLFEKDGRFTQDAEHYVPMPENRNWDRADIRSIGAHRWELTAINTNPQTKQSTISQLEIGERGFESDTDAIAVETLLEDVAVAPDGTVLAVGGNLALTSTAPGSWSDRRVANAMLATESADDGSFVVSRDGFPTILVGDPTTHEMWARPIEVPGGRGGGGGGIQAIDLIAGEDGLEVWVVDALDYIHRYQNGSWTTFSRPWILPVGNVCDPAPDECGYPDLGKSPIEARVSSDPSRTIFFALNNAPCLIAARPFEGCGAILKGDFGMDTSSEVSAIDLSAEHVTVGTYEGHLMEVELERFR